MDEEIFDSPIAEYADESPVEGPAAIAPPEDPLRAELDEERRKREALEVRLNELVEENRRARAKSEEQDRHSAIRNELQRLGVAKVDLAFRAVRDDIARAEDGKLIARMGSEETSLKDYLTRFLEENPELLPARITGGSGTSPLHQATQQASRIDLDKIKPGMSPDELEQVRQEIIRVAKQTFRGY